MHKFIALALVVGYALFLTILSLIDSVSLPSLGSSMDDKVYHLLAYTVLTLLWFNYFRLTRIKYKISLSALFAVIYGIIIEVLQGVFTEYRTPDIIDVVADVIGVALAVFLIILYKKIKLN